MFSANVIYFLSVLYLVNSEECISVSGIGTGTVLYSAADVNKQCWSQDEIALLTTRMILEEVLPDCSVLHVDSNAYVDDLIDYFKLLVETVRKWTYGRKKRISLIALSDLLGGYLRHAVLPIARQAFYAGLIDYYSMEKLIQLYEELKWYLRTNGQGWARPIRTLPSFDSEPIDLTYEEHSENHDQKNKSCCNKLIFFQHNVPREECEKGQVMKEVYVPLPFFDAKVRPSAIAVPLKRYALRNIESRKASHVVFKYFIAALKCLRELKATKPSVKRFQNALLGWIQNEVLPKLQDDKFYSAFGGILRVEATLKELGAAPETSTECDEGEEEVKTVDGSYSKSRSSWALILMIIIILLWFIIGSVFIFFRMRRNQNKGTACKDVCGDHSSAKSTLSSASKCSSRWSIFSRSFTKRSSDKTISGYNTSSSDYDDRSKKGKHGVPTVCFPPNKAPLYLDDKPAIIDTKHSMKMLPSIAEISENSSKVHEDKNKGKQISFQDSGSSKDRGTLKFIPCPKYSKTTSVSSSKVTDTKDFGTQNSDQEECWCETDFQEALEAHRRATGVNTSGHSEDVAPKDSNEGQQQKKPTGNIMESAAEDTTDDTGITANSPHVFACHSSLTGDYTKDRKGLKPYAFGYDFQTSSSSDITDDETDIRTSTSK